MNHIEDTFVLPNSPEYSKHFWSYLSGAEGHEPYLANGKKVKDAYQLPFHESGKYAEALKAESLFRRIGSYFYIHEGASRILAKDSHDVAAWVSLNREIPVYDGILDFTDIAVDDHKLAMVMKLDRDFMHGNKITFADYVVSRLARSFGKAEDNAFINGSGEDMPTGILHDTAGAEVGVTAEGIGFDDLTDLFFSVDKDYRKNGVWLMNDSTALAIRKLKDENGYPLWNHTNDTILGKPVLICNDMPDAEDGKKPIAFGDFSYYWIVERDAMCIHTLHERFFETNQIGYLAYETLDGKLIRRDAVKVLEIGKEA